jgi:hypothetical protein
MEPKNVKTEKKPTATAVVPWKERMKALTTQVIAAEKQSSGFLSFKGGALMLGENRFPNDSAEVVIVDYVFENRHFAEKYNPNKPASPVCYAFARNEKDLKPHEKAENPQAESCAGCPLNEWGSDLDGGRGKACSNTRRLQMIAAGDATVDRVATADVVSAILPVTSVRNFSTFVNQVAQSLGMPPFGVVCELSVKPHPTSLFQVHFKPMRAIEDDALLSLLLAKHEMVAAKDLAYTPNSELQKSQSSKY